MGKCGCRQWGDVIVAGQRPFSEALIRTRKGPLGTSFSYVEGHEVIRRLNEAFEAEWSFEILEHQVRDSEVVVLGRLTVGTVVKTAFGGSGITMSREGEMISVADDLKAAATDSLKKAASLLGVALHLYASEPAEVRPAQLSTDGNGNGHRHAQQGRADRLTQKQLSAIWSMGRALNLSAESIRERAVHVHGAVPEQLTKAAASAFITELGEALGGNGKSAAHP